MWSSINFTPWTIRYVIRYFSFNMLRRRPAMYIEGFNMHALEGAIHIARSISFVAVAAICIDKTNLFDESINMYRANNTLVHVQRNTYCGS